MHDTASPKKKRQDLDVDQEIKTNVYFSFLAIFSQMGELIYTMFRPAKTMLWNSVTVTHLRIFNPGKQICKACIDYCNNIGGNSLAVETDKKRSPQMFLLEIGCTTN